MTVGLSQPPPAPVRGQPASPPIDAPAAPVAGLSFWVVWGGHYLLADVHAVRRVSGRSFVVARGGNLQRHLNVEWARWLAGLFQIGPVFLHGRPMRPPRLPLEPGDLAMPDAPLSIDLRARDQRFLRAARDVLKRYEIAGGEALGSTVAFDVRGGSADYAVRVSADWSEPPRCTCPDAARAANAGFCKHIIAVLLVEEDLGYQLLDVLL
ncbi:MAG: SWIM zinc finger family protein [Deltaproteobacteria bacterium]|nr:MAG: SWIM zinc finger family protein [Deltaproteobacteria bacterium]